VEVIVMTEQDFLTIGEVCERLRLSDSTVRRMLKDGRLAGVRIAGRWRVPRAALEAYLGGDDDPLYALEALARGGGADAGDKARAIFAKMKSDLPGMIAEVRMIEARAEGPTAAECAKILAMYDTVARGGDELLLVLGTLLVFDGARRLLRVSH
jgi:excisionase family DNA binding protein